MNRWPMTTALAACALAAWWLAPRLQAALRPEPALPEAEPVVAQAPDGPLVVDVLLDHGAAMVDQAEERFMTVEISAPAASASVRRPVDLAIVLDTSGSMNEGKLDEAKAATRALARQLSPDDTLAIVSFAGQARLIRAAVAVNDPTRVDRLVDGLWHHGGTNLFDGLREASSAIGRREDAIQKVLVMTDGEATEGELRPDAFERLAGELSASGVSLSTVGLGETYNEDLLARLADLGGGRFDDVADATELVDVFHGELQQTAAVVARDTWVTISLPEGVEPVDLIGWTGQRSATGWRVYLGDVYGGERKKVVLKVRATIHADVSLSARADYRSVDTSESAADVDEATLRATDDPAEVKASLDPEAAALAQRAYGNWYLDMATRSYADGKSTESLRYLEDGRRYLEASAVPRDLRDADLRAFDTVREMSTHPKPAADAQRAIKSSKEQFRNTSR
jgi:Ca-activated chloride channel family protein